MDSHERKLEILSKLEVNLFVTATFISPKKKTFRSKRTQVTMLDVGNDAACSPLKIYPLSPLKLSLPKNASSPLQRDDDNSSDEGSEFSPNSASVASSSSYSPSRESCSSVISDGNSSEMSDSSSGSDQERQNTEALSKFQMKSRARCRSLMEANPRLYLGIDQEYLSIISLISYKNES